MKNLGLPPSPPGLVRRLGALFYDAILLLGILFFATAALLPFRGGEAIGSHTWTYDVYLLGVAYLFFTWFWTHGGQTLGMRAWKIKLCAEEGKPVRWDQASLRFFVALLSFGLLGLGFWWAWFDRDRLCWHDRLTRTRMTWV